MSQDPVTNFDNEESEWEEEEEWAQAQHAAEAAQQQIEEHQQPPTPDEQPPPEVAQESPRQSSGKGSQRHQFFDENNQAYYADPGDDQYYLDHDQYRDDSQDADDGYRHSDDFWGWEYFGDNWGWYDDQGYWRTTQDFGAHGSFFQDDGEDRDLEEANAEGADDTMNSSGTRSKGKSEEVEEEEEEREFDFKGKRPKKKKSGPVEISKPTMRWYARKILMDHIPPSEENLRRKRLLEKCQIVRKVSKPVLTLFGGKSKLLGKSTVDSGKPDKPPSERESKQSVYDETDTDQQTQEPTIMEFSGKEWALKNTIDFLTKEGCSSSSGKSYSSALKAAREEGGVDFRLDLYEKQLKRRRAGIGHPEQAPEITDAMRRHAERAVWRAVIDNTKPRYPLPRFILPRHRYLKKVQAQFIGPGSYELDTFDAQMKLRRMKLPSTWATCSSRFPKDENEKKNADEGTALLDPWTNLDAGNYRKKNPGTGIPFESTPANFRKGMALSGSGVPPNAYNIKSPLEEYIKKKTSLRGPYDCYTPSRAVIPYGYYKTGNDNEKCGLGPGSYEIRTSLVKEMNDSYHCFKGVIGKADRSAMFGFKAAFENPLWPRPNPGIPPVGLYNPDSDNIGNDKLQEMAPFKVQTGWKKKGKKKAELVAPDYYYYGGGTWTIPPKGANLASVFKSRTPQTLNQKSFGVRKERNRALNKKFDIEGGGHKFEEHYAFDEPVQHFYALEDCNDPCAKQAGPKPDPYAIPGHGVINVPGPGGRILEKCCSCK